MIHRAIRSAMSRRALLGGAVGATLAPLAARPPAALARSQSGTARGRIIHNGRPLFPLGLYHLSYLADAGARAAALRDVAAAGFNFIHPALEADADSAAFLDEAADLGVAVIPEFNDRWQDVVEALKNKRALLGWNIGDDVDIHFSPDAVRRFRQQVQALDPDHLTFISNAYPNNIARYATTAEVIQQLSFPIPGEDPSVTRPTIAKGVEAAERYGDGVALAGLQAFRFENGSRAPTATEARCMTYLALIAGAKGLLYYAYLDRHWFLPRAGELWRGLRDLAPEVNTLAPVLLDGRREELRTGVGEVFAARWDFGGRVYAAVANGTRRPVELALQLPGAAGPARDLFPRWPAELRFQNGVLAGGLGPLEAQVYVLPGRRKRGRR